MLDYFLGLGFLALAGGGIWLFLQGRKGLPADKTNTGALAGIVAEAESLERRGAILVVTEDEAVEGLDLTVLGEIRVTRPAGTDATAALIQEAAKAHGAARVITSVRQRPVAGGLEWRGLVCAARPRDYRLLPAEPRGKVSVLVDGSNVVMWDQNAGLSDRADLGILMGVVQVLRSEGRQVEVICDASVGHVVAGRYLNGARLWEMMGKPKGVTVTVIEKGHIADQALIDTALKTGAEIVTNDFYRDHPGGAFLRYRRGWSGQGRVGLLPLRVAD